MKNLNKVLLAPVLFFGSVFGVNAITNCDDQAKPALSCPPGYTMHCNPTGGYHWGCGKESRDGLITEQETTETAGVKSTMQTQVRVAPTSSSDTLQPASGSEDYKKIKGPASGERLLPTVNKATNEGANSSERVLPTVNKATDDASVERQTPKRDFGDRAAITITNEGRDRLRVIVRGWDPEKKEEIAKKVQEKSATDPNIKEAEFSPDEVRVDYAEPAKLFGFIPINYKASVSLSKEGKIKVKFPWFRFLVRTIAKNPESEVQTIFQYNESNLDFLKLQDEFQRQSQAFNTLSNVLKTRHDTAKNSVGNIR